jgi:dolichol kinase
MIDALLAAGWIAALAVALGALVLLRRLGVASTYLRDLMHVGAGAWVIGWPLWESDAAPIAIAVAGAAATAAVPAAARRLRAAARVRDSMSGGDERFSGLVVYATAFAVGTVLARTVSPVPAGAALLALSLGDGLGGLVGRRFGRLRFRVPGGKEKSFEGSATVAIAAAAGAALASFVLGRPLGAGAILAAGGVAALVEAHAPRGTDNAFVPAAVFALLTLLEVMS